MDDLISRQAAIDALRYAQHRFTVADEAGGMGTVKWSEDVIYFAAAERVLTELPPAQPEHDENDLDFVQTHKRIPVQLVVSSDCISRQAAIDALWKALYEYEDKTEKQFQESDELDVGDWILHRIFVQNMSDIDRQTILNLPPAQPEIVRCKDCRYFKQVFAPNDNDGLCGHWHSRCDARTSREGYCSHAERREAKE